MLTATRTISTQTVSMPISAAAVRPRGRSWGDREAQAADELPGLGDDVDPVGPDEGRPEVAAPRPRAEAFGAAAAHRRQRDPGDLDAVARPHVGDRLAEPARGLDRGERGQ